MYALSIMYDIMNKTAQKTVQKQFLGFKDVTRFGLVIGILILYFSWQLNVPAASIKFHEISRNSRISMSCRHPDLVVL